MSEYRLLTIWRVEAPLEKVYAAIENSLHWPRWWPGAETVEELATGDANGIDSVRRYAWQGQLPYRVVFDVRATRIESLVAIEGSSRGDLDGVGRWHFSRQGAVSVVRYEWHVRVTRWWMKLAAPLARSFFIRNHALLMKQGGEGLARLLGSRLLSQENIDLMADAVPSGRAPGRRREGGAIDPLMALVVGVAAGVLATVAQLILWWLTQVPLAETLLRDARLTAAMLMGPAVLAPPSTAVWQILLVATVIHFSLSVAYALILAPLLARLAAQGGGRLRTGPALLAGALYGLLIYAINLYGFTLIFPWFAVARDWVTLAAHLVFGLALAGGCRWFAANK